MVIKVFDTPELLLPALADYIMVEAKEAIEKRGRFNLVLSGGSSPKKLYELLASDSYLYKIQWNNVYFFFGDDRYVPHNHKDSNFLMATLALFDPLRIPKDHIFGIDTSLSPENAAIAYEQTIKEHFKGSECIFDVILLGLGDNSHTASLFPHTTVLHEKTALVKEIYVEEVKMNRITFTAPLINLGHKILFLVYGAGKAEAVKHILEDPTNIDEYPAQLIKAKQGEVVWFLDKGAAAKIRGN
ncbi:MAG: 6-phosphogluconolactonase [Cyclobacteriaceae bacterium]|nr:6-phosphogluconolactonase [Cyclobacteriaceae bacterium]